MSEENCSLLDCWLDDNKELVLALKKRPHNLSIPTLWLHPELLFSVVLQNITHKKTLQICISKFSYASIVLYTHQSQWILNDDVVVSQVVIRGYLSMNFQRFPAVKGLVAILVISLLWVFLSIFLWLVCAFKPCGLLDLDASALAGCDTGVRFFVCQVVCSSVRPRSLFVRSITQIHWLVDQIKYAWRLQEWEVSLP